MWFALLKNPLTKLIAEKTIGAVTHKLKKDAILKQKELEAEEESTKLVVLNNKTKEKLIRYQELYDHSKKMINIGNKLDKIAEKYFLNNKKRVMISDVIQLIESENSKRKKKSALEINAHQKIKMLTKIDADKKIKKIRKSKKKEKKNINNKSLVELKIGDNVRLYESKSIGTIDSIKKNKAIVNYGKFTTQVDLEKLEYVK